MARDSLKSTRGSSARRICEPCKHRNDFAMTLYDQGHLAEAEAEHRALLPLLERIAGAESAQALNNRENLARVMYSRGRHAEAEAEHRALQPIVERVFGPEHPQTLTNRMNLPMPWRPWANPPRQKRRISAVLEIKSRVFGPEHPRYHSESGSTSLLLGKIAAKLRKRKRNFARLPGSWNGL